MLLEESRYAAARPGTCNLSASHAERKTRHHQGSEAATIPAANVARRAHGGTNATEEAGALLKILGMITLCSALLSITLFHSYHRVLIRQ